MSEAYFLAFHPFRTISSTIPSWKEYSSEEVSRAYDGLVIPFTCEIAKKYVGKEVYMLNSKDLFHSNPTVALQWASLTKIQRVEETQDGYKIYATNKLFLDELVNPIHATPDGVVEWGDGDTLYIVDY